jgi:lipopolysaccharide/colanic/teichoic acid biosynthesis glycosyltransferase
MINRQSIHHQNKVRNLFRRDTDSTAAVNITDFFPEDLFSALFQHECKRSERTRKPFLFMQIDISYLTNVNTARCLIPIAKQLSDSTRGHDYKGWHVVGRVLGILFTECEDLDDVNQLQTRLSEDIRNVIGHAPAEMLRYSLYRVTGTKTEKLYSDENYRVDGNENDNGYAYPISFRKRVVDITGALFGITVFFPMLIIVALLVKLTSRGPVFFRQERVGQDGKPFHMLKFRSMYCNNDDAIHREFVAKLIKGETDPSTTQVGDNFYKIKKDPRVTPLGHFIRKTSLDELPQFFNVLKGDMSLVGPRPALPYEVEQYDIWHCRRVLARPGITGLWQTTGRSRTTFNGMVRLDIRYMEKWSLLSDLVLILRTPLVLISTKGAC